MEAMIFAAGLGTRLRPLTDDRPKALVEVGGQAMLERVARRLVAAGADHLVINVHPFAERVQAFIEEKGDFGVEVSISHEEEHPLETGGGLRHAAPLFHRDGPILVHNVDVFTDLDLQALHAAHVEGRALATLAVRPAETHRFLTFDAAGQLCGYGRRADGREVRVRASEGEAARFDFCGVQVVSPHLFDRMTETGVFSIINVYLRLAKGGARIASFRTDDASWIDVGTHERLAEARHHA